MTKLNEFLKKLKTKKSIHVIGASGTEGSEIALFLNKHSIQNVTLHDFALDAKAFENNFLSSHTAFPPELAATKWEKLSGLKFSLNLNENYLKNTDSADLIFVPQSWYLYAQNKILLKLKNKIEFSSMTRLYLELCEGTTVGVTGSSGKSTTTALIFHILSQQTDRKIFIVGNDRRTPQLLENIEQIGQKDILVSEISNRQLVDTTGISPNIAVITNITENHLAEHADFTEYKNLKSKIFLYQKPADHIFLNSSDPESQSLEPLINSTLHWYSQNLDFPDFKLTQKHNLQNLDAAVKVARILNIPESQILSGVNSFKGLSGRMEILKTQNGITYINDRYGTATDATIKNLSTLSGNITWIFGGQNKGMPVQELCKTANELNAIAVGIKSPFVDECQQYLNNLHIAPDLPAAVKLAQELTQSPGIIIFSPACEYGPYFTGRLGHELSETFPSLIETE